MQFAKLSVLLTGVAILMAYFMMASRTCCSRNGKKPCDLDRDQCKCCRVKK